MLWWIFMAIPQFCRFSEFRHDSALYTRVTSCFFALDISSVLIWRNAGPRWWHTTRAGRWWHVAVTIRKHGSFRQNIAAAYNWAILQYLLTLCRRYRTVFKYIFFLASISPIYYLYQNENDTISHTFSHKALNIVIN